MQLKIKWSKPVPLVSKRAPQYGYSLDLEKYSTEPAIYIFGRQWGNTYEALYIGQTGNLKSRLNNHLNNLDLMEHLKKAKSGQRVLIVGRPCPKQGQAVTKVLGLIEKTLIRHFISDGHDLANKQGKRIKMHTVESEGKLPKAFVPTQLHIEE